MKAKWILLFLIIPALSWAQVMSVKTVPNSRSSLTIMNAQTITGSTTPTWSSAFPVTLMEGATALFFNCDTSTVVREANESDSCLTLFLQVKDNTIGWTSYYNDATTYTRLDTVARTIANTSGTHDFRVNLADFTAWGPGDSARVGITIGVGDTMSVTITRQGF